MSKWEVLRQLGARLDGPRQWMTTVVIAVVVGVLAALGVVGLQRATHATGTASAEALPLAVRVTTTVAAAPPLVVHVAGAVANPGLQQLHDGARVADALAAAGGPLANADVSQLNLASPLVDGARVYVPAVGEQVPPELSAGPGGSVTAQSTGPLDLNRATEAQLDALSGVGPSTAAAIVAYRRDHGPFRSVDDLLQVRGIGPSKLEALRSQVRV